MFAAFHGKCPKCGRDEPDAFTLPPLPIAMSPTVQALTAQRDALLEAEQRYQFDLHTVKAERDALLAALRDLADTNNDFSEALVRARLAIARATTEKP